MVNFMMDFLLLSLVREITKCPTTQIRILIASIMGALLTCVVIILPIPYASIKVVLFHVVINTLMIMIGFQIRDKIQFIKNFIFLYIGGFLLGGVFQYFQQYIKVSSLFFVLAISSYWMVRGVWYAIKYFQQYQSKWYEVELFVGEKKIIVKCLVDTGNGLYDPYTNQPVHIVQKELLAPMLNSLEEHGARYIPYHSLGNDGVLLVVKIKNMHLLGEREYWIEKPLIALSENEISVNGNYQMILNPDIL